MTVAIAMKKIAIGIGMQKQLAIPKITNKVIHDVSMHKMAYGLYGGNTEKMLVYDMVLWYSA